jgi:hypothetical protein
MTRSRFLAIMLTAITFAGVVACSDDGDGGGSGLLAALDRVKATDSTRSYVEYGNAAAARSLLEADRKRFLTMSGFGMGNLRNYSKVVAKDLGFDPAAAREAITAGNPPDWSAIIWGDYDVAAVNKRFGELGIERSDDGDVTTWTSSATGAIQFDSPLVTMAGPGTLNNVRTAPGSFAFSPKRDTLAWVTDPGDDTLAEDPTMKTIAGCLGDVMAAIITKSKNSTETVAVGVQAPSATDVTEVVCVAPGTRDPASVRDQVSNELATGQSPQARRPWSELLPNAKVEVSGFPQPAVRITATPGTENPPGRVIQMLNNRDLNTLLGIR